MKEKEGTWIGRGRHLGFRLCTSTWGDLIKLQVVELSSTNKDSS